MHTTTRSSDFQIALPRELCESLALRPGSAVKLSIHEGAIRITPAAQHASSRLPRPSDLCKGEFTVPDDFNDIDITERRVQLASHRPTAMKNLTLKIDDETYRRDRRNPPPPTVLAEQEVDGTFPAGWPADSYLIKGRGRPLRRPGASRASHGYASQRPNRIGL